MKLKELIGVLPETEEVVLRLDGIKAEVEYDFFNLLTDESLDATVQEVNVCSGRIAIFAEIEDIPKKEAQEGDLLCENCMHYDKDAKVYPCCKCRNAYRIMYTPKDGDT